MRIPKPLFKQVRCLQLLLVLIAMLFAWPCFAGEITVPRDYPTIQQAIDASVDGDEVIVSPGTYVENIDFGGKNIVLCSTDPTNPSVVTNTVIDGNAAGSVVTFSGTEDETCVLAGFTITNGYASWAGGGIYGNNTHATIQYNTISGNSAVDKGGGLYRCDGAIQNNTISGNSADYGGGLNRCGGTIQNNTITGNSAGSDGGGLDFCFGTIQNNTISGNSADLEGGGLNRCGGTIRNCIIWGNDAPTGAQLYECSIPSYSCIQDWAGGGVGNIALNPLLVDPANGNFHLSPGSPCIDAGHTYYLFGRYMADIDGECRLAGGSVDMGADEYGSSADSDGDLLADDDEIVRGSSISHADSDDDGLIDGAEVLRETDPTIYDSPTGLSIPSDFPDIHQGVFHAFRNEPVTVSPGTYVENIDFGGKNIVLRSTDPSDPAIVAGTIIDGNAAGSVVTFSGAEDETCVLAGFTITNGTFPDGGGIYGNRTMATIQDNIISGNRASGWPMLGGYGGGGGLLNCNGRIRNNIISANSAGLGGGLLACDGIIENNKIVENSVFYLGGGLHRCNGVIRNNTISHNSASGHGGGLAYCDGATQNNIIFSNLAPYGVGGGLHRCSGPIENNTVWGNLARNGGGGLAYCDEAAIKNCIVWENDAPTGAQLYECSTPSYSCIQDWSGKGLGNIADDPLLVDPDNGDFHLEAGSPCIDTGGNVPGLTEDFEGDPRPYDDPDASGGDGSNFDIGADEYYDSLFGDVNGDGRVDAVDIQLVINAALDLPVGYDCDLDGDGDVTAVDIQLVINAVLRSK